MNQNARIYEDLVEAARGGSDGAQRALRDFLRCAAGTLPLDVLLDLSERILESMHVDLQKAARRN
jgi:hypothetical protein